MSSVAREISMKYPVELDCDDSLICDVIKLQTHLIKLYYSQTDVNRLTEYLTKVKDPKQHRCNISIRLHNPDIETVSYCDLFALIK